MTGKRDGFNYKAPRWLRARARALQAFGYECQECRRFGVKREATVVHHVWPVETWPEYAWASWNHLPLCSECHDRMHDRNTNQLTDLGERWRRRTSPRPSFPAKIF